MHIPMRRGLGELAVIVTAGLALTAFSHYHLTADLQIPSLTATWLLLITFFAVRSWLAARKVRNTLKEVLENLKKKEAMCKTSQSELRSNESFYRDILEDIPEMICRWLPDGRITYVNEAYCRYFGLSRDELLHGIRLPAFHPGAGDSVLDPAPYRLRPVVVVEFPTPQKDGNVRWQRWIDRALFNEDGTIREFQSIGEDITERKRVEDETRMLLEENQRLARMALAIQEDERARLARELHDELGQSLTAIRADAQCILRLNQKSDSAIDDCANAINGVAVNVYNTVHEMIHRLRPVLLDDLGLHDALTELLQQWQNQHSEVELHTDISNVNFPPKAVELAAFRIVQEAMTNIAKHAQAKKVEVDLKQMDGKTLMLLVHDDGVGMDPAIHRQGYGLLGMRERALALGGKFKLESTINHGLTIHVFLPLNDEVHLDEQQAH